MKPAKRYQKPRQERDALLRRCRPDVCGQAKSHNATNAGKTDREALDTWLAFSLTSLVGLFLVTGGVFLVVNGSVNHVTDFVILGSGCVVLGVTCSLVAGLRLVRHAQERRKLPEHKMAPEDLPAESNVFVARAGNQRALQISLETPDVFVLDKVTRSPQHIAQLSDVTDDVEDNVNNNIILKRVTYHHTTRATRQPAIRLLATPAVVAHPDTGQTLQPQYKVTSRPQVTQTRDVYRKANDDITDVTLVPGSGACATMTQKCVPTAATILTTVAEINQSQSATKHKLNDSGQSSIESLDESLGQLEVSGHMTDAGYELLSLLTTDEEFPPDNSVDQTYKKDMWQMLRRASHKGSRRPKDRYSCLDEIELLPN